MKIVQAVTEVHRRAYFSRVINASNGLAVKFMEGLRVISTANLRTSSCRVKSINSAPHQGKWQENTCIDEVNPQLIS